MRLKKGAEVRHTVDVEIQSRPPGYGLGRQYPEAATSHGWITTLLLQAVDNGGGLPGTHVKQSFLISFSQTIMSGTVLVLAINYKNKIGI